MISNYLKYHEGIIHRITHYLATRSINIETVETHMVKAPMSGTPLFVMEGVVVVPPDLKLSWQDELNVDIQVSAYTG